jgi:DNA primase
VSGPIPEEIIADVLSRTNIAEVIGEHLPLRKIGNGYQGLCPFHTDSKPSFYVNETRQFFHCFGCGAGGNAFHFLMRSRGMTFPEAVRNLAEKVGVHIPERELSAEERRNRDQRAFLLELHQMAAAFFQGTLRGQGGETARQYLQGRGISLETQESFGLGLASSGWRGLLEHLRTRSVPLPQAEAAGLLVRNKEGKYYDRFRGRLMFPIHDEGGRAIGFGARTLGDDLPKYINSPESPVFSKGKNLYGLHLARGRIRELDAVVVVEGYMDLLALHQAGIRHVVATLGTAITRDHLQRLRRLTPNVIHVFDGDEAGERATLRALDLCPETGVWGRVLRLPSRHDPDSYVRQVGAETLRKELDDAIPLMDYFVQRVTDRIDVSRLEGKSRALQQILPRLQRVREPIAVDHYVAMVSQRLKVSEARIHEMLQRGPAAASLSPEGFPSDEQQTGTERLLLKSVLREPLLARCLEPEVLNEFEDPNYRAVATHLSKGADLGEGPDPRWVEADIQEPLVARTLSALLASLEEVNEDPERICEGCLRRLRQRGMDRRIQALGEEIARAERSKDEERRRGLECMLKELLDQKARLKMSA